MRITRVELAKKQNNSIFALARMIEHLPYDDMDGVSTLLFNTASRVDKALHDLIPCTDDDTLETLEVKLFEAKLVVQKIENRMNELNSKSVKDTELR